MEKKNHRNQKLFPQRTQKTHRFFVKVGLVLALLSQFVWAEEEIGQTKVNMHIHRTSTFKKMYPLHASCVRVVFYLLMLYWWINEREMAKPQCVPESALHARTKIDTEGQSRSVSLILERQKKVTRAS